MNNIPMTKNVYSSLFSLYFLAWGINSKMDIYIIIPVTSENKIPMNKLFTIFLKNKYAITAPKGSDIALTNVYKNAFPLLFVE